MSTPIKVISGQTIVGQIFKNQYLNLDGKNDVTFENCVFSECGQVRGEGAKHILFYQCRFLNLLNTNEKCVQLFPGNDDWIFDGCEARYMGDFIYSNYWQGMPNDGAQRVTVRNCTGKYIGVNKDHPSRDGHFVGLQGGSGHVIENNSALETGTQIEFWARQHMPMRDCIVRNNYIRVCRALKNEDGSGIKFSGEPNPDKGLRTGNICTDNTIRDCDGYGISSNWNDEIAGLSTNHITNCKLGNIRITGAAL